MTGRARRQQRKRARAAAHEARIMARVWAALAREVRDFAIPGPFITFTLRRADAR
jgi:hypothetical protein